MTLVAAKINATRESFNSPKRRAIKNENGNNANIMSSRKSIFPSRHLRTISYAAGINITKEKPNITIISWFKEPNSYNVEMDRNAAPSPISARTRKKISSLLGFVLPFEMPST